MLRSQMPAARAPAPVRLPAASPAVLALDHAFQCTPTGRCTESLEGRTRSPHERDIAARPIAGAERFVAGR